MMDNLRLVKKILDDFGFPVLFCLWLMFRLDTRIEKILDLQHKMLDLFFRTKE